MIETKQRYPIAYHTVDVLAYKLDKDQSNSYTNDIIILLGRKPGQTKFQIPGGFVDPGDSSAEEAAVRELKEETSLEIIELLTYEKTPYTIGTDKLFYEGSFKIDDERYHESEHKIITSFYSVSLSQENYKIEPIPTDDLEELQWFKFPSDNKSKLLLFLTNHVVEKHHDLLMNFDYNWIK